MVYHLVHSGAPLGTVVNIRTEEMEPRSGCSTGLATGALLGMVPKNGKPPVGSGRVQIDRHAVVGGHNGYSGLFGEFSGNFMRFGS